MGKISLKLFVFLTFLSKCFSISENKLQLVSKEDDDGKSSLAFVFDTTGSMYNDLRQLREGAEMILDAALEESGVIADFVFVPFHDPTVGPATVTKDKAVFKDALNIVRVYGGGDCPEKSLGGIQLALNVSRPRSYVYVFTDATASDHTLVGRVLDSVQRKQTQVVFVLTGHCNDLQRPHYKVYQQIAAASSGQVFNLNKTSVHKVLDFVRTSLKGRTVNLASAVNRPGYNYTQGIPIDSTLGEVTVSVSGSKPSIRVVNPSGEELTGPPQLVTVLDLAEIMVVKVLEPEAGNWSITTGSDQQHSVKVVGLSNVTFNHGFSVETPRSMAETSYRPLQGTYNHMMIALTQIDRPVHIEYAEILSLDGKTLFEIPLKVFDANRKIYLADAFIPPDEFFYIAINGRDEYNQELRRVGATAVQAKPPDVPYLTVPQKISAPSHESVVLKCAVESLVPVTVVWTKDDVKLQPQISTLQSTSIEYVINDMREENVGSYKCVAKNIAGVSTALTELELIVDPPQVSIYPANITIESGQNVTITCMATSDALLLNYQIIFNGTHHNYVIDYNAEPNMEGLYMFNKTIVSASERDSGTYSCKAVNRGGESIQSTKINVLTNPIVQILGPHTVTKQIHADIQIVCHVEYADRLVWVDPNGRFVKDTFVNGTLTDMFDVKNVSRDGVWMCTAMRGVYNASDSVEINVLIKPIVRIEGPKNVTVLNGTSVEIVCHIVAKPEPRILWHRETETFLNNTITKPGPNEYKSVLTLDTNKEDVRGMYFCFGENSEGIHQDSITVGLRRKMILIEGFKDQTIQLYSQVTLQCRVDSYPPANITWYHNNSMINLNENLYLDEGNSSLYILKADFEDLGSYYCVADNGFEKITTKGVLDVEALECPVLSKEPVRRITQKGKSTILTCRVIKGSPQPLLSWKYKKNDSEAFTTLPLGVISNRNSSELIISSVEADHWGLYRCIAENVIGRDFYDVFLVVQFPPELKQDPKSTNTTLEIKAGDLFKLSCDAEGIPPPIITWLKNGLPVRYSKNVYLTDKSDLMIEKTTEYDSGVYTCTAKSALGSLQRNFSLTAYVPPSIAPAEIEREIEVLEGDLVELPCSARGSPKPKVQWTHNNERVREERRYIDDFGLRFVANLTDFGEYKCTATNQYGNVSTTFFIYVWVAPYIEPPLEATENILIGTNTSLRCDAVGFPIPTIIWEFQNKLLVHNSTNFSFNAIGDLNITRVTSQHSGTYVCFAENVAGLAKKAFYLNVNEPPKIIEDNYTGPYIATTQDSELVLSCKAIGNPRPYVVWSRDTYYIDKDSRYDISTDGSLIIKDVSEDLSGEYTCLAKNIVGSVNKTVSVEIYSLPNNIQADGCESSVTLLEGTNADVECPLRMSDSDKVKWYKNAKLISTSTIKLPNVSRNDAASYACAVKSTIGSASCVVRVNVEWTPTFLPPAGVDMVGDERKGGKIGGDVIEAAKGDDSYLYCLVDAKPKAKIKWLFNSKPLLGEDNAKLKLMDVQLHQSGVYKCIASNKHGTVTKQFKLQVLEPPFISVFELLDVELKLGVNATLACVATGSPTPNITWTFNNTNWYVQNTSLTSHNITANSEGLYRCEATNKAGAAHLVYRVTVAQPAIVNDIMVFKGKGGGEIVGTKLEADLNSRLRLSCIASGKPAPVIRWIKDGNIMQQNTDDIGYVDFVLENVTSENGGTYSCVAYNDGGFDEKRVKVDVLEPPKVLIDVFQSESSEGNEINLEVILGQPFFLHCHPNGNPVPEIYWFKDDLPLRLFDDSMVFKDYGEVLFSPKARYEQTGNYTCVVRNKLGSDSLAHLVDVLVPPPMPKDSTKRISSHLGRDLKLTCPIQGTPTPNVVWIKLPYSEIYEHDSRVRLLDNNVTLLINKTEVSDSGKYSCIMTNKVGTTEVTFDVTIEKAPYIAGNVGNNVTETHVVPLRRSVVLKCQADGNPQPKFSWLKDTVRLSDNMANIQRVLGSSLFAIWNVAGRDAGQYICMAENNAGSDYRRYNLVVQVPGKWSSWSEWSYCNVTCGLGHQHRSRLCHYMDERNNTYDQTTKSDKIILDDTNCKGSAIGRRKCHMPPCEEEESSSRWSVWSRCSASCGAGTQARRRRCHTPAHCSGDNLQIRKCPNLPPCDHKSPLEAPNNDVFTSKEAPEISAFIPEATFEMQPEMMSPHSNGDVEDFYFKPENKYSTTFYEVNVTENLDKSYRGPCAVGYTYNNATRTCEDIDECSLAHNTCHATQACVNSAGAYACACAPGYLALAPGQRCLDINECDVGADGCEYACVNTAGGYVCACPRPLRLHADRHRCVHPSSYRRSSHEELTSDEYLSTNIDLPSKYVRTRN